MAANPMKNLVNNMVMGKAKMGLQNPNMRQMDPTSQTLTGGMQQMDAAWQQSKKNTQNSSKKINKNIANFF